MAHKRRCWTLKIALPEPMPQPSPLLLPIPPVMPVSHSMIISLKSREKKEKKNITRITVVFFELPPPPLPPLLLPRVGKTKIRPLRHLPNAPCPQPGYSLPTQHSSGYSCLSWAWLTRRLECAAFCCERFFGRLFVEIEINVPEITSSARNARERTPTTTGSSCPEH